MARSKATPKFKPQQDKNQEPAEKKKRKYHAGTQALRQIRRLQKSTDLLIRKAPFKRLVREIADEIAPRLPKRFAGDSFRALQEASEKLLTDIFSKANRLAIHAGRLGVSGNDIRLCVQMMYPEYTVSPEPITSEFGTLDKFLSSTKPKKVSGKGQEVVTEVQAESASEDTIQAS